MGTMKVRFEGNEVVMRVCFDQAKCDGLMAQFKDGVVVPGQTVGTTDKEKAWFARELAKSAKVKSAGERKPSRATAFTARMRATQPKRLAKLGQLAHKPA